MKKNTHNRYKIEISTQEKIAVLHFLEGGITSRELGKTLSISHQQAINFVTSLAREWYQGGHLCYYETPQTPPSLTPISNSVV